MGLFDGAFGDAGNGILPDWLFNRLATENTGPQQMAYGQSMPFSDRLGGAAELPPMQTAAQQQGGGMFGGLGYEPLGWNTGAYDGQSNPTLVAAMQPQSFPSGNLPMPQPRPAEAQQAYERGLVSPGMELPPNATPTVGAAPVQGGLPQIFGGLSQGMPSMADVGNRLGAGFAGFANSGAILPAISNLIGGIMTGQRQDPQGIGLRLQQQAQVAAYQAVRASGGSEAQALAAASNPEVFKALAPELFGAPKVVQTGEDMYGGKQFQLQQGRNFSPIPGQGSASGAAPSLGGDINHNLAGEEYLAQFPPEVQSAVKNYVEGKSMPTGNPRKGFTQAVKMIAQKYGDEIGLPADDTSFAARRTMRTQLSSTTPGSMGGQVNFGNTSLEHLMEVAKSAEALKNQDWYLTWLSQGVNSIRGLSTDQAAKVNALQTKVQHYGQEITKFYAGSPGGEAERNRFLQSISAAKTPQELAAAIQAERELIPGRMVQIENQIKTTLGEEGAKKYPTIRPGTQHALDEIDATVRRMRGEEAPKAEKSNLPRVNSPADAAKLPKGTRFLDPNGKERIVP